MISAAASQLYFRKSPEALSVGEAAMLAGLVKAPSRLAPTRHLQAARTRTQQVITAMVETGRLTEAQAASAAPAQPIARSRGSKRAGYYADWTYQQLLPVLAPAYGGKTGTSQSGRDALFVGFAGDLVVGVWVGNDDGRSMPDQSGGRMPALIWRGLVEFALSGEAAAAERAWEEPPMGWGDPRSAERRTGWPDRPRDLFGV